MTGHLWVLACGRSRTSAPCTRSARRRKLRSKASRSTIRAGVSTSSRLMPISAGGRVVIGVSSQGRNAGGSDYGARLARTARRCNAPGAIGGFSDAGSEAPPARLTVAVPRRQAGIGDVDRALFHGPPIRFEFGRAPPIFVTPAFGDINRPQAGAQFGVAR